MVRFRFTASLHVGLVNLGKHFIIDWTPSIVFKSHIPTVVLILLRFIEVHIYRLFTCFFLHLHVITRRKCVNVNDTTMHKDLVEYQWGELGAAETETHVALRSCVEKSSLRWVD